jgi:porin
MPSLLRTITLLSCLFVAVGQVRAQEPPNVEEVVLADPEEHLLGDLGRGELEEEGIRIELFALNDFWGNVAGGNSRGGGALGNANLIVTLDTEKMGAWDDGTFVFWALEVYGRRPSQAVGDFQFTDSIDAPTSFEAYEAYYEHSFMDDSIHVLGGIHDFTLEFAVLDYAYTFINSSFITPPTITAYPLSFYPTTGLGSRMTAQLTDELYTMVGLYDGKPANYSNYSAQELTISKGGGIYSISEVGWLQDAKDRLHTKIALGGWYNSGTFTDSTAQEKTGNYGTYLLAEQQLWREEEGDTQGLGIFLQVGQARNDRNTCPWYIGTGLAYKGLFEGRDEDVAGIGVADAHFSQSFKEYYETDESSERAWELNYRAKITSAIALTPDIQYVMNPYANPDLQDALVLYLRTEVAL